MQKDVLVSYKSVTAITTQAASNSVYTSKQLAARCLLKQLWFGWMVFEHQICFCSHQLAFLSLLGRSHVALCINPENRTRLFVPVSRFFALIGHDLKIIWIANHQPLLSSASAFLIALKMAGTQTLISCKVAIMNRESRCSG